jgi:hypothetical protein
VLREIRCEQSIRLSNEPLMLRAVDESEVGDFFADSRGDEGNE